ncbi:MAG: ROK family protein [Hyphomicrobiaceae bacterium]
MASHIMSGSAPSFLDDTSPASACIGIDLGGTKIEGIVLTPDGRTIAKRRIATPRDDYSATIAAIAGLVDALHGDAGSGMAMPVGLAMPGSIAPSTGLVQNANSTWLNDRPFATDLAAVLPGGVRLANDANCFALSEAEDGAAAGAHTVFGVILGTGCGGGIVIGGSLVDGPRGTGGEWGHNPLPWPAPDELAVPPCWCGRTGCMETWVSGPALALDHQRVTGEALSGEAIVARAASGDRNATATLHRHASRLARGLAHVVNLLDPEVIVLGGGLSGLAHLYDALPRLAAPYIFAADRRIDVRKPRFGDASGARGAARLWRQQPQR